MTKSDAEKFARECLYNYRMNEIRYKQKLDKYKIARLNGSRTQQYYGERGGSTSVTYIDSTPEWIEEIELLEHEIPYLRLIVKPIRRMLFSLEMAKSDMLVIYRLKYEQRLSWEKAKLAAQDNHNIGHSLFQTLNSNLIINTKYCLDVRVIPEPVLESVPETVLENA